MLSDALLWMMKEAPTPSPLPLPRNLLVLGPRVGKKKLSPLPLAGEVARGLQSLPLRRF
jgi:hypothetical protein